MVAVSLKKKKKIRKTRIKKKKKKKEEENREYIIRMIRVPAVLFLTGCQMDRL